MILNALVKSDPNNEMIPKLVKGLLAVRRQGKWDNTQENCWATIALNTYFSVLEKDEPKFRSKIWLANEFAGDTLFEGRKSDSKVLDVPMRVFDDIVSKNNKKKKKTSKASEKKLKKKKSSKKLKKKEEKPAVGNVMVLKEGKGRLYYRLGMRYAFKDLQIKEQNYGFKITRYYKYHEEAEEPSDKKRDTAQDVQETEKEKVVWKDDKQVWHVKKGVTVKVVIEIETQFQRYNVAVVDKVPAGFEPENALLKALKEENERKKREKENEGKAKIQTGGEKEKEKAKKEEEDKKQKHWYQHENLRDERVECFADVVPVGHHVYEYYARATTPGRFIVPPCTVEEMYTPDIKGQSNSDIVCVD